MTKPLRIAAAQFPVSGNITRNRKYILAQMEEAARRGVEAILFPETALAGYGPKHISSFKGYDWQRLAEVTNEIRAAARRLSLWVILGSMREGGGAHPYNCLQVISNDGEIAGVYDKRRIYKTEREFYTSGEKPLVIEIGGHRCGFLICFDNCYPELYEEYRAAGVGLLFHACFNAGNSQSTKIKDLGGANLMVRAADHRMWIAASNSSARFSPLAACITRPDGSMIRTKRHVTSIAIDDYPLAELGWTYDNRVK